MKWSSKRLAPALLRCTGDHAAHRTTRQAGGVGCLCAVVSVHRPLSTPAFMSVSFVPQVSVGARQCRWNGRAPSTFLRRTAANRSRVPPSSSGTTAGIRTGIARLRQHGNAVARCLFSGSARIDGGPVNKRGTTTRARPSASQPHTGLELVQRRASVSLCTVRAARHGRCYVAWYEILLHVDFIKKNNHLLVRKR